MASALPDEETFDPDVSHGLPGGLGVDYDQVRDFPEIPLELMDKRPRVPCVAKRWKYHDEDIFVLESRALLQALRVAVSLHHHFGRRLLFLVDNMSVALCFPEEDPNISLSSVSSVGLLHCA